MSNLDKVSGSELCSSSLPMQFSTLHPAPVMFRNAESQSSFSHNNPPKLSVKTNSSKQLSFLLNVLLKRFSQKDQSPCHHQTLQILLSLLLLSSPQLKTKQKTVSYLTKTPKSSRPYNSHSQKYPSFPSSNDASCLKISTHLLLANEDFCP